MPAERRPMPRPWNMMVKPMTTKSWEQIMVIMFLAEDLAQKACAFQASCFNSSFVAFATAV
jgi:hypothetical protein